MIGVFGGINIDISTRIEKFPNPDDEVEIKSIEYVLGGNGANTSAAIEKLGGKAIFFGAIGKDYFGEKIKTFMKKYKFSTKIDVIDDEKTGICYAVFDKGGNRRLMSYHGANKCLNLGKEQKEILKNCNIIHFSGGSSKLLKDLIDFKKENKKIFSFDPGSMMCRNYKNEIHEVLEDVDILFLNSHEYELLGQDVYKKINKIFLYKQGENGGQISDGKKNKNWKTFNVKQVDSTAAGDVFNAAFLTCYDRGEDPFESIDFASAAGALATTREGAFTSLPEIEEVKELFGKFGGE